MDLIWFDTERPRLRYVDLIKSRASSLPFVRLALLMHEPRLPATEHSSYPMVICIWRIKDGFHEKIEQEDNDARSFTLAKRQLGL